MCISAWVCARIPLRLGMQTSEVERLLCVCVCVCVRARARALSLSLSLSLHLPPSLSCDDRLPWWQRMMPLCERECPCACVYVCVRARSLSRSLVTKAYPLPCVHGPGEKSKFSLVN